MRRPKTFLTVAIGGVMVVTLPSHVRHYGERLRGRLGSPGNGDRQALFVQTDNPTRQPIMVYDRAWDGTLSLRRHLRHRRQGRRGGRLGRRSARLAGLARHRRGWAAAARGQRRQQHRLAVSRGARRPAGPASRSSPRVASSPSSIAVHGDLVYVLNAGVAPARVQGYWLVGDHLWPIPGSNRSLGLANTTPPYFLASPGQVGFYPRRPAADRHHQGQRQPHRRLRRRSAAGVLRQAPVANPSAHAGALRLHLRPAGVGSSWSRPASSGSAPTRINPDNSLTDDRLGQ